MLWLANMSLLPSMMYSGVLLLGLIVGLALLNLRKRITFLPIGSAELWLQIHIYAGLFSGVLFAIHAGWNVPSGLFEQILALSFGIVFLSGIVGLAMSRYLARQLTHGDEVLFDRIPARIESLGREAESLTLECLKETNSTTVPQLYADRLSSFFVGPRNHLQHLLLSRRPGLELLSEIKNYGRYASAVERLALAKLSEIVVQKDRLDFQYALQLALKLWLLVHVPATCCLLVFTALHVLLVTVFTGGL